MKLEFGRGLEQGWLGSVPERWSTGRLKDIASASNSSVDKKSYDGQISTKLCNYVDVYYNDTITSHISFMDSTASEDEIAQFSVRAGEVVITKDSESATDIGIAAYVPETLPGVVYGYHLSVLRARENSDGRFIKRLFDSYFMKAQLATRANGLTRVGLGQSALMSTVIPIPPLGEQRQIAEYLDRETGKIDELIAKQEQLVATLTERRHSFIDELVAKQTRGEGEGLTRVKNLYSVIDQRTGSPDLPLLSVSIHYGVRVRGEMTEDAPKSSDLSEYKVVRPNDIVINRMRAFQGALGCSPTAGVVSPDYLVLRPKSSVDPNWLALVFRSKGFVGEMTSRLRGIGSTESGMIRTPRINVDDLGGIEIRVPSLTEQIGVTKHVSADVELNSAVSDSAIKMVAVLRERRAALISAAVTGKIDVSSQHPEGALA